eukprot:TRINITY_DN23401_c0_g1_i1.p1 TRINITY_DN23401_c0_g1~~TRINITY_DN23401_c0_g1_i1.p1  ORF type:complete len:310 (+),score=114.36 TRINITY_DN23401_c0_g1_i1:85-930(+)
MAVPLWVVICIVLIAVLFLLGIGLFVYGYFLKKGGGKGAAPRDGRDSDDMQQSPRALRPLEVPPPRAGAGRQSVGASVTPTPPALHQYHKGPAEVDLAGRTALEREAERLKQFQREIEALEGEKWALANPWEGQVLVRCLGMGELSLPASSGTPVGQLALAAASGCGLPPGEVLLSYGGRALEPPERALGTFRVSDGAVLHAMHQRHPVCVGVPVPSAHSGQQPQQKEDPALCPAAAPLPPPPAAGRAAEMPAAAPSVPAPAAAPPVPAPVEIQCDDDSDG